jgi:hypothetical protein
VASGEVGSAPEDDSTVLTDDDTSDGSRSLSVTMRFPHQAPYNFQGMQLPYRLAYFTAGCKLRNWASASSGLEQGARNPTTITLGNIARRLGRRDARRDLTRGVAAALDAVNANGARYASELVQRFHPNCDRIDGVVAAARTAS